MAMGRTCPLSNSTNDGPFEAAETWLSENIGLPKTKAIRRKVRRRPQTLNLIRGGTSRLMIRLLVFSQLRVRFQLRGSGGARAEDWEKRYHKLTYRSI